MKLYRTERGIVIENDSTFHLLEDRDWNTYINDDQLAAKIKEDLRHAPIVQDTGAALAPLDRQELWACGVTYLRSKIGRQEESKDAGGGDFYARVYEAERPEVFFKANAHRVADPGKPVRIRKDSGWDVPEPELTLVVTSSGKIVGYTIGNDMSSRSIEGENPLYLPQAKTYDGCASVGPCIRVTEEPLPSGTNIHLEIRREDQPVFRSSIAISQMKRTPQELVSFVFRECSFPHGCFIMTGTGIVPDPEFTLKSGDEIGITIDGIGTLRNPVE